MQKLMGVARSPDHLIIGIIGVLAHGPSWL
jgi:hypothetical protein